MEYTTQLCGYGPVEMGNATCVEIQISKVPTGVNLLSFPYTVKLFTSNPPPPNYDDERRIDLSTKVLNAVWDRSFLKKRDAFVFFLEYVSYIVLFTLTVH